MVDSFCYGLTNVSLFLYFFLSYIPLNSLIPLDPIVNLLASILIHAIHVNDILPFVIFGIVVFTTFTPI